MQQVGDYFAIQQVDLFWFVFCIKTKNEQEEIKLIIELQTNKRPATPRKK